MSQRSESLNVVVLARQPVVFAGNATGLEKFFELEHWRVRAGDREDDRVVWARGEFVLVVAITPQKEVVLIREYKQAVEQTLLCIPAGRKKKNESPQESALRELKEETGYTGTGCHVFGPYLNSPDKSTERHYVVVVFDAVRQGEATPEENETILGVQLHSVQTEVQEQLVVEKLLIGMHHMAMTVALKHWHQLG